MNKESLNLMHRLFPQAAAVAAVVQAEALGFTNQFPAGSSTPAGWRGVGDSTAANGSTTQ